MGGFWQDLRYAWRTLRKDRGSVILALVALALGIGATTAIFSVIQNVLLDPFPYTDGQRLVMMMVHDTAQKDSGGRPFLKIPEFLDYRDQNHAFDRMVGVGNVDVLYDNGQGTEQFDGAEITTNTFAFLGMAPLLGRGIGAGDDRPDAPAVFVMAYKMWSKSFARDPQVIGRVLTLNGKPRVCVGVMPQRFTWWGADLWLPASLNRGDPDVAVRGLFLIGHMPAGVSQRGVEADLLTIAKREAVLYPADYPKQFTIETRTVVEGVVGRFRTILYVLLAAVSMLLLIACGNVANLLLARATAREKEMAIRTSLGASRLRIVRQLLAESLLLGLGGAALGCLFASAGLKSLVALIPPRTIPDEAVIRLNFPVLLFSLGLAFLTAVICGLAPAWHAGASDTQESLKDGARGSSGSRHGRLRNTLVASEVALSMVLLIGAGLLMRSFFALQQVDLGLNPEKVLVARLPLPRDRYQAAGQKAQFFRRLLPRLRALPGVIAATETSSLPPYGGIGSELDIPGKTHSEKWTGIFQLCSEGYFRTLGIQLVRGRGLTETEVDSARKVAVVNQTLVKKYFGAEDPLGRHIKLSELEKLPQHAVKDPLFEIVGVVRDAKNQGVQDPPLPEVFIPYTVTDFFERGILVRTAQEPLTLLRAVRGEVWSVDPNVALTLTGTLRGYLKDFSYAGPEFGLILMAVFAGIGLALVAIGVYGVMSYTVSRQVHEIGIRMALGAPRGSVLGLVIRNGLRLIAIGIVAGLAASFGLARLLASQLFGVSANDPLTFTSVAAVLAAAGLAACYFPANRATRVDPLKALRHE